MRPFLDRPTTVLLGLCALLVISTAGPYPRGDEAPEEAATTIVDVYPINSAGCRAQEHYCDCAVWACEVFGYRIDSTEFTLPEALSVTWGDDGVPSLIRCSDVLDDATAVLRSEGDLVILGRGLVHEHCTAQNTGA